MSPINSRRLLALAAAAFLLRAACALITEVNPIFPTYYYTDAQVIDTAAEGALQALNTGTHISLSGTLGERLQIILTIGVFRVCGPRPLAVKLTNAILGAAAVALLGWSFALIFGEAAALAAASIVAAWPSAVFYTSQNLKESPTHFLAYAALAAVLTLSKRPPRSFSARAAVTIAAAAALIAAGSYRPHVLLCLASALAIGMAWRCASGTAGRSGTAAALASVVAAAALYTPVAHWEMRFLRSTAEAASPSVTDTARQEPRLIPMTVDETDGNVAYYPTSPAGITLFRRSRQAADRRWAQVIGGREIGTQIFPEAVFNDWGDLAAFLPKSSFYVLFMPLPGLYPMAGKVGRIASGFENSFLLLLTVIASIATFRRRLDAERLALLIFFLMMAGGSATLEFDLGSASRHKLLYLPMLFPFAAEEALRLLGRKESA